jgi:hypothetical protein
MNRPFLVTFVIASLACASSSALVAACSASSSSGAPQVGSDSAAPPQDGAPPAQGDASPPSDAPSVVGDSGSTPHVDSGPRLDGGPPPPPDSGPGQDYLVVKIDGTNVAAGQLSSSGVTTDSGESGLQIGINLDPSQSHSTQVEFDLSDRGEGTYVCGSLAPQSLWPAILYTVVDYTANPPTGSQWVSEVNDAGCTIKLLHYDVSTQAGRYIEGEVHGDVKRAGDSSKHVDISFRLSHW